MTTPGNDKSAQVALEATPLPYEKPVVVDYGSVQELTEANPGSPNEAGGRSGNRGTGMM